MSSKLSNRRRTARKPPVCLSGPAVGSIQRHAKKTPQDPPPKHLKRPGEPTRYTPRSGRCPPPPPPPPPSGVCSIYPDEEYEYFVGEGYTFVADACTDSLPEEEPVACHVEVTAGEIESDPEPENCIQGENFEWTAPDEPQQVTMIAVFTWSDSSECTSILIIDVAEENGNDD